MQTTVNDIASLFMGNPGALQNRIQKEQQAKPGIPPDLKELLALQQINEQIQASQQQQALQNPQNQPTVAQSLQQRAKQALMARQIQAQQQQMARSGLPMAVPQGTPQPQRQPEMGLDQIPTNLGEYYGGGIVAFKEGDLVEPTAEEIEAAKKPYIGVRRPPRIAGEEPKKYEEDNLLKRFLEVLVPSKYAVDTPVSEPTKDVAPEKSEAAPSLPEKKPAEKLTPSKPRPPGLPGSPRLQTAAQQSELAGPPIEAMNKPMSKYEEAMAKIADMDPAEIERQRREQYDIEVGKPQFAEERELIKELQARRANIGKGTNPLLDLLEGISASAPGRGGVLSQGAEGVRNARAMQQQREQQNMDMLKEILGQQKTITTGERAYKENLFALGKKVYDETFTQRFDALKAQGMDERQAKLIASEEARAKQRLILEREQIASQERQTNARISSQRELPPEFQFALKDPEKYAQIMAMKNPAAANRGQMNRDQAEDNFRKDMENFQIADAYRKEATEALKKQGIQNPTMSDIKEYFIQKMMKGSPYAQKTGASGGSTAVYNWNDISNPPK
jgi:hypothetical protein